MSGGGGIGWVGLYGCVFGFIHTRAEGTERACVHQVEPHAPERVEEEEEAQQPGDEPSEDGPDDTGVAVVLIGWIGGRGVSQSVGREGWGSCAARMQDTYTHTSIHKHP